MMPRTDRVSRLTRVLLTGVLAAAAFLPAAAQDDPSTLEAWSDGVWKAAAAGDQRSLETYLTNVPEAWSEAFPQIYEKARQYQVNRESANAKREEARAEALQELRESLAEGDLLHALRSAVAVQTLGVRLDDAFEIPEVQQVIAAAKVEIPAATKKADWLIAQELLYRLRTLYDDTERRAEYNETDRELKNINRRVVLLAEYAPKRLFELRTALAERLGDEPPVWQENNRETWQERREGIDSSMLRRALSITASEHIEAAGGNGWRPLLMGGLSAMRLVATTPGMEETFEGLADDRARGEWLDYVDIQTEYLSRTPDASISARYMMELISGLETVNRRTVNMPEEVLYHEYGNGAMYELGVAKEDEYTAIIWPNEIRRFRQSTDGKFVGIGVIIGYNDKQEIQVVNPLEGTPAFRAGVRSEDVIIKVDGQPTLGWTLNDAVDRITGPRGTTVKLTLRRTTDDEVKDIEYSIARDVIELHSVKGWWKTGLDNQGDAVWDWFVDPDNRIAYVRLTGFSEDTTRDLLRAWEQMNAAGPVNGLILDLRYNPGGLLDQAVNVVNLFVPRGPVVSIEGKNARDVETLSALPTRAAIADSKVPTVVLVNKGSASASEIVAGALQAHGAAVVVGKRTWGKGSVQRVYGLTQNAQIKITTQYYRLPPGPGETVGRIVHKRPNADMWGVEPDIDVDMTPEQIEATLDIRERADMIENPTIAGAANIDEQDRPAPTDLITNGLDPQLETALLILQARTIGEEVARNGSR